MSAHGPSSARHIELSRGAPSQSRRQFLATMTLISAAPTLLAAAKSPVTPADVFVPVIEAFMQERGIPGGALAVVKDRRLVYAKGFGWADREKQVAATADSLFRIASISKPITAVAVLKLVEMKRLTLDARPFELLDLASQVPKGTILDLRWKSITLRQLLHHTGGWDRDRSGDPMFNARQIAKDFAGATPASPAQIIRWMLGRPLDFDPGTRYAYSNFGYCLLGRVIEKATGQTYEKFVRKNVLAPAGIRRMKLGASLEAGRADGEARYYMPEEGTAASVFSGADEQVPWPHGGFNLEAMDAHGGWIASAVDLARFAAALDDPKRSRLLKPASIAILHEPPAPPVSRDEAGELADHFYVCGWMARPVGHDGRANYWHSGSLPGTYTMLVRLANGISYAILFNQRSDGSKDRDASIDSLLNKAAQSVTDWPAKDLFKSRPAKSGVAKSG